MEEARDAKKKKKKQNLAATSYTAADGGVGFITDDLVVDILARVPVKSICRFKCVSPSWRDLISHPDNRKKLPQTLTGFFYFKHSYSCIFVSLAAEPPRATGRGCLPAPPSPCDFLPANTAGGVVDCCNGLVLLNISDSDSSSSSSSSSSCNSGSDTEPHASLYVVCNPATEKWTTVPAPGSRSTHADKTLSASILCFDPAVSAHFHVVQLLDREEEEDDLYSNNSLFEGFNIYSSETGAWVFHPHYRYWYPLANHCCWTFFNGLLHFITDDGDEVAALDMEGQTPSVIPLPQRGKVNLIGNSQGRLVYANGNAPDDSKLSIHVLEENGEWTLKHCIDIPGLFADADAYLLTDLKYVRVAAIHPHGDSIFLFDSLRGRLMSYGMGSKRNHVICTVECRSSLWSFVPYVPLYLEMAALDYSTRTRCECDVRMS